ncbi:MAG: alkaline phosphatase [Chitinispirillales bacterium]|jgi:alkaline phosphatase|nr:alkaline phosphatase [Chitinispirillales bacterium]
MRVSVSTTPLLSALLCAAALMLSGCARQQEPVRQADIDLTVAADSSLTAKYVFLFIGDGMGLSHVAAAEAFLSAASDRVGNAELSFTRFAAGGLVSTFSADSYITCSAASGTAFATGYKTNNGMVCVGPQGQKYKSIAYILKDAGYRIGIATNVSIDHATPAVFYAVEENRDNFYAIARQLAPSGFDFFAGSGFLRPRGEDGKGESVFAQLEKEGYAVARTPAELKKIPASKKLILLQEESRNCSALVPAANRTGKDGWTLADFTRAGTVRLDVDNKGFFFMVEGGQIDWAGHANDAAGVICEVIDLAGSVEIAVEFYRKHPDETLLVVTADHATGGLSLGNAGIPYELKPELLKNGRGKDAEAGFGWTTGAHTGEPVPVYALGVGSERFMGRMDNTDIPKRILGAMGVRGQF